MKKLNNNCFFALCLLLICNSGCRTIPKPITDIDGNIYKTVKIGNQVWMAENLKVTRYRNGDTIPDITGNTEWSNIDSGAYCYYNNNDSIGEIYGKLYNWYAITDSRVIAPEGWHIPGSDELRILIDYLGGEDIAAGKMKEAGFYHWLYPNTGGVNESGFSALPGGYRLNKGGTFHTLGSNCYLWTTTESYEFFSWSQQIFYFFADQEPDLDFATYGFSVRCVKD